MSAEREGQRKSGREDSDWRVVGKMYFLPLPSSFIHCIRPLDSIHPSIVFILWAKPSLHRLPEYWGVMISVKGETKHPF